jgi:hypothetical protein
MIERYIVLPISNLVATRQIGEGDILLTDLANDEEGLVFLKRQRSAIVADTYESRFDGRSTPLVASALR